MPDGVRRVVEAFERARSFLLDELGYAEPPVVDLYPLYVSGAASGSIHELPGGTGRSKPSYVVMPPELVDSNDDRIDAFAVHEYLHAIQVGYDSDEAMWIREATSAWVEDVFVDQADPNHHYLRRFLPFPGEPLTSPDGLREYGAFLFFQFLVERYAEGDPSIVREAWEQMAVPEAIEAAGDLGAVDAIEAVLDVRAVTLADAWGEFLLWQRRLAHFEEGEAYRRAVKESGWPSIATALSVRKESCRIDVAGGRAAPLAGEHGRFTPDPRSERSSAALSVKGPPGSTGYYVVKPVAGQATEHRFTFDGSGVAQEVVPFAPEVVKNLSFGVGHVGEAPSRLAYSLRVEGAHNTSAKLAGATSTTFFTPVAMSASVLCGRRPAGFADVLLVATDLGTGEATATPFVTDDQGSVRTSVLPEANSTFRLEVVDPLLSNVVSAAHSVTVRVHMSLVAPSQPVEGLTVSVEGVMSPVHPGADVTVQFRRPAGTWRDGPTAIVRSDGSYATEISLPRDGVWEVRALGYPGDEDHAVGVSAMRTLLLRSPDDPS